MQSAIVDGATLYSPSKYLIFTNLSAVNCAMDLSPCTTIGNTYSLATVSVGQSELSTDNCFHSADVMDYRDYNTPIPWSIVSTQIGCTLITESHPGSAPDYDYTLLPNIVYPEELKTAIDPAWYVSNLHLLTYELVIIISRTMVASFFCFARHFGRNSTSRT